ncbi:MAG: efflux RND transporter periplasmic adaptor subunit [Verrucomicrobia bacterium]|nr:efflux RND transporter periplasmic adaptor subunit [Verrucomicrobiota bacterium]
MNLLLRCLAPLLLGTAAMAAEARSAKAERLANTVILTEAGVKNLRLKTVEVEEQAFAETLFALGRIAVRPGRRAVISSRISGRALKVEVAPDHEVRAGAPVVVVESRQPGDPPPQITLTAPISGLVTDLNVAPGQPVSPDAALLSIVDLSSVYAVARVPEHLAAKLKPGLTATIRVPGWPGEQWEARLEHLGVEADPASGTLEAAFYVTNENLRLRPGMRAEFSVTIATRPDVMAVPRTALQGDPADRFVYVADQDIPFAFVRVPVVTGAMNDRFVEIQQGLLPGDRVVTEGAYSLAFAGKGSVSLKEALDAAHGHEHAADGGELPKGGAAATESAGGDGHDHGSTRPRMSGLTLTSLIANGVLLVLLAVSATRRPKSDDGAAATPPKAEGSGHA